ncbi:membrane dipeptidase/D-alanyl-D-alanine dipeptidase [Christiangramia gaetbulicola]|uniref:Membrane dipeptidase/D-alanyl-D-alanine dipeptidase n=1 Tax=Christiangramia gaetbulicola TaxID=703340 RepID=A0A2T6AH92_9FLAO|nr:membrane dipeptidase [Christiangramia gaetbulicola]PTX43152.1 membrane dipeptidase/D-alanyl-D-alanine dipeptidase [Christiangramia gaetbulicola]
MRLKFTGILILTGLFTLNAQTSDKELLEKARKIHENAITIDTHNDINVNNFTEAKNYTMDLDTQVNLPKLEKGGIDVSWLIVYTGQKELNKDGYAAAYENAISKFEAIHKLIDEIAPDKIGLATNSEEVRNLVKEGKKVAMIGVENAYPIGTDLKRIKEFYDRGARYMSLSHNGHSQFCDSNTGEENDDWLYNGLSELGKEAVAEMNKYGIMIDVSHPSKEAIKQMFELSKAPLIASHSSARALCDHSRNLDDELLELFKMHGGVVQTVAFSSYLNTEKDHAFAAATKELYENKAEEMNIAILEEDSIEQLSQAEQDDYYEKIDQLKLDAKPEIEELKKKVIPVNVSDFVDHIDYLVEKIGIDHVGISSDFDGGGGIDGWQDASETLNVTIELVKRGYSEEEIKKLWGENLLRVLDEVQAVAKEIQKA